MGIEGIDKRYFWIILLVMAGIVMAPVSAADWYVSTTGDNTGDGSSSYPWRTIAYAVEENASVSDGDAIHIAAGTYSEWNIAITKNLTVSGDGAESTIVDGMYTAGIENGGVLNVSAKTLTIEGLTIRNGLSYKGGGIHLRGGTTLITGCTIEGNRAYYTPDDVYSGGGGGVFLDGGSLALVNSTVRDNFAMLYGGGIHADDGSVTISGCVIADNVVDYSHGGGVSQVGGTLEILESTIENNRAGGYGGGVRCRDFDSFTLSNSTVVRNIAEQFGGGVHQEHGVVTVTDSILSNNSATLSGGGVFQDRGTMTITNSRIDRNTANYYGGGVHQWEYGTLTITGSTIIDNVAEYGGWGVHSRGTVTIANCMLRNTYNLYRENGNATLNTTRTPGTSIVYGPYLGGNYWATPDGTGFSQTHADADGDGIIDEPYVIEEGVTDYLPLAYVITAAFTADPTAGDARIPVRFTDTSTGEPTSWSWDFGDGATSTEQNPAHSYAPGIYTVALTVENEYANDTAVKTDYITAIDFLKPTGGGGNSQFAFDDGTGTLLTSSGGKILRETVITSGDGIATLTLPQGIVALDGDGDPIAEITIEKLNASGVPAAPDGATFSFAGFAYECSPAGATFAPAITLSFTLSADEWEAWGGDFSVRFYDESTGAWVEVPVTIDAASHTVTATVSHFSVFALFAEAAGGAAPAAEATIAPAATVTAEETSDGGEEVEPEPTTTPESPLVFAPVAALSGMFLLLRRR